jgi:transcriptional regulator GlxA family with amidase domain
VIADTSGARRKAMIDVTVLLLGGCYASTALGPVEVFYSAGTLWSVLQGEPQAPRFRVTTAAFPGRRVVSPYGVGLVADAEMSDIRATNLIIVPSAGLELDAQLAAHRDMYPWLRRHAAKGAYIAGVCAGSAYLAEAGLLDGREATTHWASAEELQRRYPKVKWRPDRMITEDRRVLCSGGVYASMDLSLYLVEKFCGHETALQVAKSLVINMPRACQAGYAVLPLSRPHDDDSIRSAEKAIERNFKQTLRVEDLARERHMSARNFVRRFKAAPGTRPAITCRQRESWWRSSCWRAARARCRAVCGAVGYEDAAFFRALFRRHTGMSPAEYRERFGSAGPATGRRRPRGRLPGLDA